MAAIFGGRPTATARRRAIADIFRGKDRREALGLNQSTMATAMGWSQQTYSAFEGGTRRIDVLEFFAITRQLGLVFDDEAVAMIRVAMQEG